jgi:hypothetical protein
MASGGRKLLVLNLSLALLVLPVALRASDPFSAVRSEVRTEDPPEPYHEPAPPPPKKKPTRKQRDWNDNSCQDDHCDDNDDDGTLVWGALVGAGVVVTAPYWGPHSLLEGNTRGELYFAPSPYEVSEGAMLSDPTVDDRCSELGYVWATRVRAEYLNDFDNLTGYRAHVLTEHANRFGFDGEVNYWTQSLTPGSHDELWTGDANVVFRFAQSERVQLRSGIGLAWLSDHVQTDLGFNFTYGGDFYPINPLVVSAEMDGGWIGQAWFLHLRSTVGVQYRQVEVYTGYDYLEIGNAQLDGWVAGVRVLF